MATAFGKMMIEHGALAYREFQGDDLKTKETVPYPEVCKLKSGEILIASVVDFKSRKHRDAVMKKVQKDPRFDAMVQEPELSDHRRMIYGGFSAIVNV